MFKTHLLRHHLASIAVYTLKFRRLVLFLYVVSTAFMTVGLFKHFNMDMSLESWFYDDDPSKIALDKFRAQFGSDDGVYIVYEPQDKDVFSVFSPIVSTPQLESFDYL